MTLMRERVWLTRNRLLEVNAMPHCLRCRVTYHHACRYSGIHHVCRRVIRAKRSRGVKYRWEAVCLSL
jgi:hypothetical protein